MKLKFLILISSLLILPLAWKEMFSKQLLRSVTSEVEEEIYVDVTTPIVDDITIEDNGSFGSKALVQEYNEIEYVDIPVKLNIGSFLYAVNTSKIPCYISYCCLKIAC